MCLILDAYQAAFYTRIIDFWIFDVLDAIILTAYIRRKKSCILHLEY